MGLSSQKVDKVEKSAKYSKKTAELAVSELLFSLEIPLKPLKNHQDWNWKILFKLVIIVILCCISLAE